MLGSLIRVLVIVPEDRLGLILDTAHKLSSKDGDQWKRQLSQFLRKEPCWTNDPLISCTLPVFIPEGWSVLPDSEQLPNRVLGQVKFDPSKVKLHLDEGQKEGKRIQGNELRKKLVNEPVYTAHILDYLLKPENQHLIPEEWKDKVIFFWGTIYRASYGSLSVRSLNWHGDRWRWDYFWLVGDWRDYRPSAVSASPPDRTTSVVRAGS